MLESEDRRKETEKKQGCSAQSVARGGWAGVVSICGPPIGVPFLASLPPPPRLPCATQSRHRTGGIGFDDNSFPVPGGVSKGMLNCLLSWPIPSLYSLGQQNVGWFCVDQVGNLLARGRKDMSALHVQAMRMQRPYVPPSLLAFSPLLLGFPYPPSPFMRRLGTSPAEARPIVLPSHADEYKLGVAKRARPPHSLARFSNMTS